MNTQETVQVTYELYITPILGGFNPFIFCSLTDYKTAVLMGQKILNLLTLLKVYNQAVLIIEHVDGIRKPISRFIPSDATSQHKIYLN